MNIYDFYNQRKQPPLIVSLFPLLFHGKFTQHLLCSVNPHPPSDPHPELHPQNLGRCSLRPLRQLLKVRPSRRPFLVARRKEGWLIPTCPNTGLPHLSLLTLSKKTPASLLVLDLERPLPAAARQPGQWPCVCTWSLSPDSWKEAEEQRPLVSLSLDDEEGGDDFSVCMS